MHSRRWSLVLGLVALLVNATLLFVYFGKQGHATFAFLRSLWNALGG